MWTLKLFVAGVIWVAYPPYATYQDCIDAGQSFKAIDHYECVKDKQ